MHCQCLGMSRLNVYPLSMPMWRLRSNISVNICKLWRKPPWNVSDVSCLNRPKGDLTFLSRVHKFKGVVWLVLPKRPHYLLTLVVKFSYSEQLRLKVKDSTLTSRIKALQLRHYVREDIDHVKTIS